MKTKLITRGDLIFNSFMWFIIGLALMSIFQNNLISNQASSIYMDNYSLCNNLSLKETSYCLRDYVSSFYNYTRRVDTIKTIDDIKKNGGDCYDYSELYKSMGVKLGFRAYTFNIIIHQFAVLSDDTGYCKIDLLDVSCISF